MKQKKDDLDFTMTSSSDNDTYVFCTTEEKESDTDQMVAIIDRMRKEIVSAIDGIRDNLFWVTVWLFLLLIARLTIKF